MRSRGNPGPSYLVFDDATPGLAALDAPPPVNGYPLITGDRTPRPPALVEAQSRGQFSRTSGTEIDRRARSVREARQRAVAGGRR
jgi:hypothetical protein